MVTMAWRRPAAPAESSTETLSHPAIAADSGFPASSSLATRARRTFALSGSGANSACQAGRKVRP